MNLPKLEACGNFVREARTPENLAGFAVAEIPLYAQSDASGIATEIARRCNEYDELKARVAELEAELYEKHTDTQLIDEFETLCGNLEYCDADDVLSHWRASGYAGSHERAGSSIRDALRATIDAAARKNGGSA